MNGFTDKRRPGHWFRQGWAEKSANDGKSRALSSANDQLHSLFPCHAANGRKGRIIHRLFSGRHKQRHWRLPSSLSLRQMIHRLTLAAVRASAPISVFIFSNCPMWLGTGAGVSTAAGGGTALLSPAAPRLWLVWEGGATVLPKPAS